MNLSTELTQQVTAHLNEVRKYLENLPADERKEILQSIESHIYDALQSRSDGEPTPALLEAVIAEMDPPESYGELPTPPQKKKSRRKLIATLCGLTLLVLTATGIKWWKNTHPTVMEHWAHSGKIVAGIGVDDLQVNASRKQLIKALGAPDKGSTEKWLQWRNNHYVHCLVHEGRGASELRFDLGFPGTTAKGITFGSSEAEALDAYGIPEAVAKKDRWKKLEWSSQGILVWLTPENGINQIVVFRPYPNFRHQKQSLEDSFNSVRKQTPTSEELIGHWITIDVVSDIKKFDPKQKMRADDFPLTKLTFLPNGQTDKLWGTWTNNFFLNSENVTKSVLWTKKHAGDVYLFLPWISDTDSSLGYLVLKKQNDEHSAKIATYVRRRAERPPIVVSTFPLKGDNAVDPNTTELRVTFNKDMLTDRMWSWCTESQDTAPKFVSEGTKFIDNRTCTTPVELAPNKTYVVWINTQKRGSFRDINHNSAVPYRLEFRTGNVQETSKTDNIDLPIAAQSQDYTYTSNGGAITITGYSGTGGDITIPDTISGLPVISIGINAFRDTPSLTSVTIPNSVTSIEGFAFYQCSNLKKVTIPTGVTSIGQEAFCWCTSLTDINLPESLLSIGEGAFCKCTSLKNINIPDSTRFIGTNAFWDCSSLTDITIPNGFLSIEEQTFWECSSLTNVTLPSSLTSIGRAAFADCPSLTNIALPENLASIGVMAFLECKSLSSITIPNSVNSIEMKAFWDCSNLTNIFFEGNAPALGQYAFRGITATIYYLPGTTGWSSSFGNLPTVLWEPKIVIDGESEPDPTGYWQSADFVSSIEQFDPETKSWRDDLYLKELTFLPEGKTDRPFWTWKNDILHHSGDDTDAKLLIKKISGEEYLFMEWMSGDVIHKGLPPKYYVLKRTD